MTDHRQFCNEKRYFDEVAADGETWLDREVTECKFQGERLGKRFRILLERLWGSMSQSIPFACQDWANTPISE